MPSTESNPTISHEYLAAAEPAAGEALTILSANLQNPFARIRTGGKSALLARLEAFARLAESAGADILLCQEVGRHREFRVDNWIAARLHMAYVYTRANGDAGRLGREEGLAIFSRYPLSGPISCLLAGGIWRRPALGVVVHALGGDLAVYTAHLSLRPWRNRRQPGRLRAWIEATSGKLPAVIGGDFNAGENAPQIARLRSGDGHRQPWIDLFREINPVAERWTHEMKLFGHTIKRHRLDYLFLRAGALNFRIMTSSHLSSAGTRFSDHLAVMAKLGLAS